MSVLKRFRKPTGCDYVDALWELRKYSLYRCSKFPVRYKTWFTDDIVRHFADAHEYAFRAYLIDPVSEKKLEEKHELLEQAMSSLQCAYPQLELAYDMCEWDKKMDKQKILVNVWLPMIDKAEEGLCRALGIEPDVI